MEVILPICGTIVVGVVSISLSHYLSRKAETDSRWRAEKVEHYRLLLSALSGLAVDGVDKRKANEAFSHAVNTVALVAPQSVVSALMAFHEEARYSNPNRSDRRHDELLKMLLLEIRKDLAFKPKDDPDTFSFHLIGSAPKERT